MVDGTRAIHAAHSRFLDAATRWMFVLAHPGHELRAYHLMERVRPLVCVLTDGSGSTGTARVDGSLGLLAQTGAVRGPVFGALTDRDAYSALMSGDAGPFLVHLDTLADLIVTDGIEAVLVDAAEGYNPVHDLCHWLGQAAVQRARECGSSLHLFEVDLVGHPDLPGIGPRLLLDDEAFTRKLAATAGYEALKAEADAAFDRYGSDAFRVEFLRAADERPLPPASWVPYYEEVGNARVREGRYASVLRYGAHVRPVLERLLGSARSAAYASDLRTPDE
jgi:hypothetical protein